MNGGGSSVTLRVGWVLLALVGVALAVGGLASLHNAYTRGPDPIAGVSMERLAELSPELPAALRGRRATAAAASFASGMLLVWLAAVPYRRGEKWAWQAVVTSVALALVLSLLRMPMLDTRLGAGSAGVLLVVVLMARAVSSRDLN